MTIGMDIALRNARLTLVLDAIEHDGDEYSKGSLGIYSGIRPATGEEPDEYENDLLTEFIIPWPCGTVSNGVLTFNSITDSVGLATGYAVWGRICDANGDFIMDLSVTDIEGNGDIKINYCNIYVSKVVQCINATITEGNI